MSATSINVDRWTLDTTGGTVLFVEHGLAARQRRVFGIFGSAEVGAFATQNSRHIEHVSGVQLELAIIIAN